MTKHFSRFESIIWQLQRFDKMLPIGKCEQSNKALSKGHYRERACKYRFYALNSRTLGGVLCRSCRIYYLESARESGERV